MIDTYVVNSGPFGVHLPANPMHFQQSLIANPLLALDSIQGP